MNEEFERDSEQTNPVHKGGVNLRKESFVSSGHHTSQDNNSQQYSISQNSNNSQQYNNFQDNNNSQQYNNFQDNNNSQQYSNFQNNNNSQQYSNFQDNNSQQYSNFQDNNSQQYNNFQNNNNSQQYSNFQNNNNSQQYSNFQNNNNSQQYSNFQNNNSQQYRNSVPDYTKQINYGGMNGNRMNHNGMRNYTPPPQYNRNLPPQNFPVNPPNRNYPPHYPPQNQYPVRKNSSMKTVLICTGSIVLVVVVAFIIFFAQSGRRRSDIAVPDSSNGSSYQNSFAAESSIPAAPQTSANEDGPQISIAETPKNISDSAQKANDAYNKAVPSVVCITAYQAGTDYALTATGEGSGIIITADGYIATNSHVVDDSSKTGVMITLSDGKQYLGTVIGVDVKTDLAVIKIAESGLTAAEMADSDLLQVGQEVFAIGNPGGASFSNSMTKGTVSALNRSLSSNGYVKYIQTDAAINPGNSGGALINEFGQVVGMNTAKISGNSFEGMGFAIPSDTVIEIINKLIKYGYVNDRGTLDIEGRTCTLYMSKANNVPQGMMITKIKSTSPLYNKGVYENDIIIAVNNTTITSSAEFIEQMKNYKPGDTVTLTVYQETKKAGETFKGTTDVTVTLIEDTTK